ncbi:MAG: NADPH-dependent 7-cyano-7-deazaguanine reductase QueF [Succinivibrio sp.]
MNLDNLILGKSTTYDSEYSPSVLQRIERSLGRASIDRLATFYGYDIWKLYEITYLNLLGIPQVCMGIMKVPSSSTFIVESKSLKLYTLSYTMTRFINMQEAQDLFASDLSRLLECEVSVSFYPLNSREFSISAPEGICLEQMESSKGIVIRDYGYNPDVLCHDRSDKTVKKTYYTNLFRSLCPVTSQPDHATVIIDYEGKKPSTDGLLSYLVSLRSHQGFHEQCAELIFSDLMYYLKPEKLTVTACFTRRGGIDINPVRSNQNILTAASLRTIRQ